MVNILFVLKDYSKKRNTRTHTFPISDFYLQGHFSQNSWYSLYFPFPGTGVSNDKPTLNSAT